MASNSQSRCFIDMLPNELLVHIFIVGSEEDDVIEHAEDHPLVKIQEPKQEDVEEITPFTDKGKGKGKGKDKDELEVVDLKEGEEIDDDEWADEEEDDEEEKEEVAFPVIVSHVCRRWRTVVLGIPELWTKLQFTGDYNKEQAETCLARSRDAPLNIHIDLSESEEEIAARIAGDDELETDPLVERMREILDLLIPHVHHWGQLFVESVSFEAIELLLTRLSESKECISTGAPMLQLLHIGFADQENIFDFEEARFRFPSFKKGLKPFGGKLPVLQELSLWEVHLDWSIFVPPTSATQHAITNLTALELRYHTGDVRPTIEQFRASLINSPNLESLVLYASAPHPVPESYETRWETETIRMSKLVTLTLATLPPRTMVSLLKMLVMPAIQKLTVEFSGDNYSDAVLQLAAEVEDTHVETHEAAAVLGEPTASTKWSIASKLTYLKIGSLNCDDSALELLYTHLKNVETIDLNMNYVTETAGRLLFPGDSFTTSTSASTPLSSTSSARDKLLCPKLRTVFVSGVDSDEVCLLVKARAAGGAPLKEVMMDMKMDVEEKDLSYLKEKLERVEFVEYSDESEDDFDEDEDDDSGYEFDENDAHDEEEEEEEEDEWMDED